MNKLNCIGIKRIGKHNKEDWMEIKVEQFSVISYNIVKTV